MMLRRLCFLWLCFIGICCKAQEEKIEWEKHEFSIYSIELPTSWPIEPPMVSVAGDTVDNAKPCFREYERKRRWGFVRNSRFLQSENFEEIVANMITVFIESLESKTEAPFTIEQEAKEAEEFYSNLKGSITEMKRVSSTDDEIIYTFKTEERTIPAGTKMRKEGFMVFKQDGGMVHRIHVYAGSKYMKKNPEVKAIMKRILRSFTPR